MRPGDGVGVANDSPRDVLSALKGKPHFCDKERKRAQRSSSSPEKTLSYFIQKNETET
jgi:hypothetical protein